METACVVGSATAPAPAPAAALLCSPSACLPARLPAASVCPTAWLPEQDVLVVVRVLK